MSETVLEFANRKERLAWLSTLFEAEQLQTLLDVSQSQAYRYMKDFTRLRFDQICDLADAKRVDTTWLSSGVGSTYVLPEGHNSQGFAPEIINSTKTPPIHFDSLFLSESLEVTPENTALVIVKDDAMLGTLKPGDLLLIDRTEKRGDGVYAIKMNGDLAVRRLQFQPTGHVKLICDNESYDAHLLTPEDFKNIEIIGKSIWRGGR